MIQIHNTGLPTHSFSQLQIRQWREDEYDEFCQILTEHHYLGSPDRRQIMLGQCVFFGEKLVALFTWTHACQALQGRDEFVGWDNRTRTRRLAFVIQNNRFLLLTPAGTTNIASHLLAKSTKSIVPLWKERFGITPLLAETFVNPERFTGGCYKGAGWTDIGNTKGYARYGCDFFTEHGKPKMLWLKLLSPNACADLRDPSVPLEGEKKRAPGKLPISSKQAESLTKALRSVKDPRARRGRQFPLSAMLSTAILALCCGAKSVSDIFRFCQDLTSPQRLNLGFWSNPKAPKVVPPPGESCWRDVLSRVDCNELATALNTWRLSQIEIPELLSIDGKVIGANLATLVSIVDVRDGTPIVQMAASGNGKEQELSKKLIESLPNERICDSVISGDALYSQKDLVKTIVYEKGANVFFQLKNNQPTSNAIAEKIFEQNSPLFCPYP